MIRVRWHIGTFHGHTCPILHKDEFEQMYQLRVALLIVVCLLSQQLAAFAPVMSSRMAMATESFDLPSVVSCHDQAPAPAMAKSSASSTNTGSGMAAHQGADCCENSCQCSLAGYQLMSSSMVTVAAIPQENGRNTFSLPDVPQAPENTLFRPPITR